MTSLSTPPTHLHLRFFLSFDSKPKPKPKPSRAWTGPNLLLSSLTFKPKPATPRGSPPIPSQEDTAATHALTTSLRHICEGHVPDHVMSRAEDIGYVLPTDVQLQALPILFSGRDCVLHAQTGSGKTLAYLLSIFSVVSPQRSAVQALIVVPTRELGIQVTKVARMLAAKHEDDIGSEVKKHCSVMALLDGGMLKRHKTWLKAEPPTIVVATIASLCQMLEKKIFKLDSMQVLVVDEVDFMFNSSKQVSSLRKLLTLYSSCHNRQTILVSASIPQHNRFLYDCMQQKWTKSDVVHVHVNPIEPMPSCLQHRFVISGKTQRHQTLLSLLQFDAPKSCIVFVGQQSEKSERAGHTPQTIVLMELLRSSCGSHFEVLLLEEDVNFNARAASLSELRQGKGFILVATDIAARGVDLPEMTHIYNFELPRTAIEYLHRSGRTGRKPFSDEKCYVTSIIAPQERFVLQRYENELMFQCEEIFF